MTYANSRLRLGILGVGSFVLLSVISIIGRFPYALFAADNRWSFSDVSSLGMLVAIFTAMMLPLDIIGGFVLPKFFGRQNIELADFFRRWVVGVSCQATLFLAAGIIILAAGRLGDRFAATSAVFIMASMLVIFQQRLALLIMGSKAIGVDGDSTIAPLKVTSIPIPVVFAEHKDPGFTGGVVGLPSCESIVLPRSWSHLLSPEQLSVAIARRLESIQSGSRTRGLVLALSWVCVGFLIASFLPGAGVTSVAELVTTSLGYTCWTFLGLLTLPTVSRQAAYAIDHKIVRLYGTAEPLMATLRKLDQVQDDEPTRPSLVETIFHPVPSLENRSSSETKAMPFAWHSLRTILFLSWACLGLLSRAVHCNVGRPELWVMLPTD
jgi:hypothetical protein